MASGCILSTTGQSYAGCDFSQYIAVGRVYPIYSPGYDQNQRYPPGTNCRWMAYTDPNYQLIVDCREMSLPSVSLHEELTVLPDDFEITLISFPTFFRAITA